MPKPHRLQPPSQGLRRAQPLPPFTGASPCAALAAAGDGGKSSGEVPGRPRKIIFHLRGAIVFYICSGFGVGLIATPLFPLRLESVNILPKHPRRHASGGERLACRVQTRHQARCAYTSDGNVTEISADFRQCYGVTGHQRISTLHPPVVMASVAPHGIRVGAPRPPSSASHNGCAATSPALRRKTPVSVCRRTSARIAPPPPFMKVLRTATKDHTMTRASVPEPPVKVAR